MSSKLKIQYSYLLNIKPVLMNLISTYIALSIAKDNPMDEFDLSVSISTSYGYICCGSGYNWKYVVTAQGRIEWGRVTPPTWNVKMIKNKKGVNFGLNLHQKSRKLMNLEVHKKCPFPKVWIRLCSTTTISHIINYTRRNKCLCQIFVD